MKDGFLRAREIVLEEELKFYKHGYNLEKVLSDINMRDFFTFELGGAVMYKKKTAKKPFKVSYVIFLNNERVLVPDRDETGTSYIVYAYSVKE